MERKEPLGKILIDGAILSEAQLAQGLKESREKRSPLGKTLIRLGMITEEELLSALSLQLGIPYFKITDDGLDPFLIKRIPATLVYNYKIFPIKENERAIIIAISDPLKIHILDNIRLILNKEIEPVLSTEGEILSAIKRYYGIGAETVEGMIRPEEETLNVIGEEPSSLEDMAKDASIIRFVNQIILEAYESRASDIHIEPYEKDLRIRYRIDGILYEVSTPPP